MADSNHFQFRATDEGVAFVEKMMDKHGASRTDVLRAMFKVASQFPDRIGDVLEGRPLGMGRAAALASLADAIDGPSGLAGMRASKRGT